MKKIPSALKWLAEKRARVAGQLQASEATLAHIDRQVAALEKELAAIKAVRSLAAKKVAQYRSEVATLDSTVLIYDDKIDPSSIGVVKGWSGRYGKQGALRDFLLKVLRERAPEYVSSSELSLLAMTEFSLAFDHWKDRKQWHANSLRNALKALLADGLAERQTEDHGGGTGVQGWRARQEQKMRLADLRKAGAAAG